MTLTATTAGELSKMVALAKRLGAAALHLFVLVPTGRARLLPVPALSPTQYEELLERACDLAARAELDIRVTCGPQFARVVRQRAPDLLRTAPGSGLSAAADRPSPSRGGPGVTGTPGAQGVWGRGSPTQSGRQAAKRPPEGQSPRPQGGHPEAVRPTGCLAGVNFCFIGAEGTVQPCGYFQVDCGNVRREDFLDIWRNSPTLQLIRRRETYKGKCGQCEYVRVCGGCRARAYEATGDPLGADPLCAYLPVGLPASP
jgi:radical SAM protein with 4Fe4S-binding SPASM domain